MSAPGDPRPAAPGDYWDRPDVVTAFHDAPAPPYLAHALPPAAHPTDLALDAGCGGGRNLPLIGARGYRFLALDLHAQMLRAARARGVTGGRYAQADVRRIPLADATASVIVCHGVLHNLPDPEALAHALAELRRVATASALLSLNLFSADHIDPALRQVAADRFALANGQVMTLLTAPRIRRTCTANGWTVTDGPHQYLSAGDPGTRSVWRATLRPHGATR